MLSSDQEADLESPLTEKDLSEKGKNVLLYIAKHENSAQHEVKKKLEVDYQLLSYHFDQLKEKNLIREAGKKETKRGPKRKTYEPTIAGSLYAYSKDPDNPQIVKYSEKFFPLIVGKREVFREHNVDGIILDSFRDFARGWWGFGRNIFTDVFRSSEAFFQRCRTLYVAVGPVLPQVALALEAFPPQSVAPPAVALVYLVAQLVSTDAAFSHNLPRLVYGLLPF